MPISIPDDERAALGLPTAQGQSGPSMPMPPNGQPSISGREQGWKRMIPSLVQLGMTAAGGAVGGLGGAAGASQGFAAQAIPMMQQNRQRQIDAEDFNIKRAHEAMAQLKTLKIQELRGKVPDAVLENVMNLTREYNEALMETSPGKGTITPAEAAKIVQHYGLLQNDITEAQGVQSDMDQQSKYTNQARGQREAEVGDISLGMADANKPQGFMGPPDESRPMGSMEQNAQGPGVRNQAISEWARRNQPINVPFNGQQIPVSPDKIAPYAALGARQEHWGAQESNQAADRAARLYLGGLRADVQQRIAQSGRQAQVISSLTQLYNQVGDSGFKAAADRIIAMGGGPPHVGNPVTPVPAPRSPADWGVEPR